MRTERLLASIAVWLARALLATCRFRIDDQAGVLDPCRTSPLLWMFWHNRLLAIPKVFEKFAVRPGFALTSASRDGEILAAVLARFGVGAVRGSSSRRGAVAWRELKRRVEAGADIAITPDGPRGPRYTLGAGIVKLAQATGAPIVPINVEYSRFVRMGRWDGFMIPLPFARVEVCFGPLQQVPPTSSAAEFEAERRRLETVLRDMMRVQ